MTKFDKATLDQRLAGIDSQNPPSIFTDSGLFGQLKKPFAERQSQEGTSAQPSIKSRPETPVAAALWTFASAPAPKLIRMDKRQPCHRTLSKRIPQDPAKIAP
ncbi:hypothetical protein [Janthinobacterium sp.]|uniref:hypothetical protein n=1 Tax=Janthinobacterium sp. TaxID=1871054 RepID=UPI00293D7B20|nr:hypothetical protein [Janthinobacterium sp.]